MERLHYGTRRLVIAQDLRKSSLGRSSAYLLCCWTRQFSFELSQNHATSGLGRCGTQQDVWNGFSMVIDGLWSPKTWASLPWDGLLHTYCVAEHASFRLSCHRIMQTSGLGRFGIHQDVWNGFSMVIECLWSPKTWASLPLDGLLIVLCARSTLQQFCFRQRS